jgi:hypothetical protein
MLKGVLTNAERHEQMAKSMHLPLLKKKGKFNDRRMTIACYGPSLAGYMAAAQAPNNDGLRGA